MSNSFVNSQLFSNGLKKESYIKTNMYLFGYYATALEGKISYSEWMKLSPKERDYAIESQEEIQKIRNEALKSKPKGNNVNNDQ